ncbi:Tripartite-type tricarboxylate transporter, receptor component TctC [Jannaschia faecimaris]|uniref:Tripartite-type tricarboxylate transporter, receptor component TctC n=1 Tax=Jannaschia faecimaris TaxID=1244108 RepID=A0A1H3S4F0_9RHOB|nr:tripartite tricarboxylate transporter substrate binding protein [Jannaschia faecimaris]SDZ32906.1 Tripartite-type tricarboxylate transporter, receptor component TctC [Jannaschia faecimaris]
MKLIRSTILASGVAAGALLAATGAFAEPGAWSEEPVRIVVTFPPGGTSDLVARLLAQHLDTDFGQKAVVDNRPGAAGTVAADYVSQQAPDGTTLILANNAPYTIAPTRFKSIPYDPIEGATHVAYIGASAPGLFVQPSSGITTLEEYTAVVKETPMTYGSSGVGSISHILGEAVDAALEVESIHVPYQGSSPAIQDFRAGVLDSFYDMVVQNSDMIEDKEAVAIAIASPERNPQLPDVPTFMEQGYDIVIENWVGLSGPAGMDPAMVEQINETVLAVFASAEVQERLTELGITHRGMNSQEYTDFVAKQIEVWAPLIVAAGIAE